MKKYLLLLSLVMISSLAFAQNISWLQSDSISLTTNPQLPLHKLALTANGAVLAKTTATHQLYGSFGFGDYVVDKVDTGGMLLFRVHLYGKIVVTAIATDGSDNIYVSGKYMETLYINGNDSLTNTGTGFNHNYFLMSFTPQGVLRWKKNLTLTNSDIYEITTMEKDANGAVWYVWQQSTAFNHHIVQLDTNGNEIQSYTTSNTRLCSSISFDPNNNLYLAGSTESGTITINGYSETVPEQYMMFASRINSGGQTSWVEFAYDITFQDPQIVALGNGDAILGGTNMDSTNWGTINFPDNFFGTNIFVTRIDSTSNFLWGYALPLNDTGYFAVGKGHFFDVDSDHNIYIGGTVQGTIHFTPGIVIHQGLPATYNMAILKLDGNGQVISLKTGGTMNANYPQEIRISDVEQGFMSASIRGEATFDAQTTGTAGVTSSMLLRFDDSNFTSGVENLSSDALLAYPNPFSNQLKIVGMKNNVSVQLYDITGKLTYSTKVMNEVIQLPELVSGVYLLHIGDKVVRLVKAN